MITETAADVAALIPRHAWLLMDEEQRDALMRDVVLPRYMETTTDGVKLGPTWWAETVGATFDAIENRVRRLRQSQKGDEEESSRARRRSAQRHAKVVLRDPEQRKAVLESLTPGEVGELAHDITEVVGAAPPETSPIPTPPTPKATDPSEYEIDHLLLHVAPRLQQVVDRIESYGVRHMRPLEELQDTIQGIVDNIATIASAVNEKVEETNRV